MGGTYPKEILTCRDTGGGVRLLLVKYEAGLTHRSMAHRRDLAYEAQVYDRLLRFLPEFRPQLFAAHVDRRRNRTWLIMQYLDGAIRLHDIPRRPPHRRPAAMAEAARWIALFHV